ncbi:MAG: hypothetical protein J5874_00825 [Oscillospiraceae bacterium]|nr:hypothetical protein [Oscillospiraceae bacterium]
MGFEKNGLYLDASRKKVLAIAKAGRDDPLDGGNTVKSFCHAILLEGEIGSGRYTAAKLAASEKLDCGREDLIMRGIYPDVITIEQEKGIISVDKIRAMKADAAILPNEAEGKVYIVRDVQNMTAQAQNAFLKLLEEPPKRVSFILTVDNRAKLLETIVSRVAVLRIDNFTPEKCAEILKNKYGPKEGIDELSRVFEGNIGKTEQALKDGKNLEMLDTCVDLINSIFASGGWEGLELLSGFEKDDERFTAFLEMLKTQCIKFAVEKSKGNSDVRINRLVRSDHLLKIAEIAEETKNDVEQNVRYPLLLATFAAKLRRVKT